jgi:hypothetical protein
LAESDDKLQARLNAFLNRYGFARNLAFTSLAVGAALAVRAWWVSPDPASRSTPSPRTFPGC